MDPVKFPLTATTFLSLVTYCAIASARPLAHSFKSRSAANSTGAMVMNASNGTAMGAIYCTYLCLSQRSHSANLECLSVMTNQPEGNFVVSADINSDGTLVSRLKIGLLVILFLTCHRHQESRAGHNHQWSGSTRYISRARRTLFSRRCQSLCSGQHCRCCERRFNGLLIHSLHAVDEIGRCPSQDRIPSPHSLSTPTTPLQSLLSALLSPARESSPCLWP
jgi:hypothetical protein